MIGTWLASVDGTIFVVVAALGMLVGATAIGTLPTARQAGPWTMAFFVAALGLVFFGVIGGVRAAEGIPLAERTIGTASAWVVFAIGTGAGARLRT